jgi:protein TonB
MLPAAARLRPLYPAPRTRRWPAFAVSAAVHTLAFASLGFPVDQPLAAKPPGPLQLTWITPASPPPQPPSPREKRAPSANKTPAKRPAITTRAPAVPAAAPASRETATADAAQTAQEADAPSATPGAVPPAAPPMAQAIAQPIFNAAYLRNPAPAYPATSRRYGETGRVLLRVRVLPSGQPDEVVLQQSCGHQRLDAAALDAVRRWRFVPARQGEQAIAAWVVVPIQFNLQEAG